MSKYQVKDFTFVEREHSFFQKDTACKEDLVLTLENEDCVWEAPFQHTFYNNDYLVKLFKEYINDKQSLPGELMYLEAEWIEYKSPFMFRLGNEPLCRTSMLVFCIIHKDEDRVFYANGYDPHSVFAREMSIRGQLTSIPDPKSTTAGTL